MIKKNDELVSVDTVVSLVEIPAKGNYSAEWAKKQFDRIDKYAGEFVALAKGEVIYLLKTNIETTLEFEKTLADAGMPKLTQAYLYLKYFERRDAVKAVEDKTGQRIGIAAGAELPKNPEVAVEVAVEANAQGGLNPTNVRNATMGVLGTGAKGGHITETHMEDVEKKLAACRNWLSDEHKYSPEDIERLRWDIGEAGKSEFEQLMFTAITQNYPDWKKFYKTAAKAVHPDINKDDDAMIIMLNGMNVAVKSLYEYIEKKEEKDNYMKLREHFMNKIYPTLIQD